MLTKTNSWLRAGALTVLGLGLAYGAQSFTEKEEVKPTSTSKVNATVWHFKGTNSSQILQADKWEQGASSDPSCQNDPSKPLPCQYTVTDQPIADSDELMSYFAATYPSNTANEVRENADSRKPETP